MTTDVLIAGAGLAGTVAAHVLARQGIRVMLVEARAEYPASFKAEKIEPDQAELLRELGLLECLLPHSARIHQVLDAQDGRVLRVMRLEQYGIHYHDMVNELRRRLPPEVDFRLSALASATTGPELQQATLADSTAVTARLLVIAGGTGGSLTSSVGLRRRVIQKEFSVAYGFDIARRDGRPFSFQSMTYLPDGCRTRIAFLTLFLIRDTMRANLFAFRSLKDDWSKDLVRDPSDALARSFPKLSTLTGPFEVRGAVQPARIDLYEAEGGARDGLIPVADAFRSACPTSGTGVSKALTDVYTLCVDCIPRWLATPGMGADKLASWYRHPRKRTVDEDSRTKAEYRRQFSLDESMKWRVHRARTHLETRLAGWPEAGRLTRRLRASTA